jgi:hypothetical protein
MSLYAKIENNTVVNVIVCDDVTAGSLAGEHVKVTSLTNNPYVGGEYRRDVNKFIEAKPPYDSWILNDDLKWESPQGPQPAHNFDWDEESQEWIDQPIKSE